MSLWNYCKFDSGVWFWSPMWSSQLSFWWDVKYPHRAPFPELHYMSNVVSPWNAEQELAAPALQGHLVKLVVLLYIKMLETKWKKVMWYSFLSWPKYIFPFVFHLLFNLKGQSDIQKFWDDFCKCCSLVPWQCSLVAWGGPLPLLDVFLNSEGAFARPAVQKSTTSFF